MVLFLAACSTGENQVRFATDFASGSIGAVKQLDDEGRRLELVIDCARCQMEVRLPARSRGPRRRPVTRT